MGLKYIVYEYFFSFSETFTKNLGLRFLVNQIAAAPKLLHLEYLGVGFDWLKVDFDLDKCQRHREKMG